MDKFTVEEFKTYLKHSDSMGDALHFLSADTIREALRKESLIDSESAIKEYESDADIRDEFPSQ